MLSLRYYSPHYDKQKEALVRSLLDQIKNVHGITYEIVELRLKKSEYSDEFYVDESHEKEIYESDFRPLAKVLSRRVGEPIRLALRSQRGRGHYYIAGVVAITGNEQVEWFIRFSQQFNEYDSDATIGFLKAVLSKGPELLDQLCPPVEGYAKLESVLVNRLIDSGLLKGEFKREVRVGGKVYSGLIAGKETTFDYRKSIDALCYSNDAVWVIEAKNRLNYESLGEVLTYGDLYKKENPKSNVRLAVLCNEIDAEILETCVARKIAVFEVAENNVEAHWP